jgi:RHH-type transcriptional regulator, rel operon repressor / antitoxin RelB
MYLKHGMDSMTVSLRLPEDIANRLTALARRTGRSKTYYMIEAIREHLDDLEGLYLAERRLIDIREGRARTIPLEDVMKRHGLAD